jgi:hypothetical protein
MPDSEDIEKAKTIERARAKILDREEGAWKRRLARDIYLLIMLTIANLMKNGSAVGLFGFGVYLLGSPTSVDLRWVSYTVSTGEGLIIAAILIIGGLILLFMPASKSHFD